MTFVVTGCANPVSEAEDRYAIVKKGGGAAEICREGEAVTAAYLAAKNADGYQRRRVETSIECQSAQLDEKNGNYRMPDGTMKHIEPDNMDAL